MPNPHHQDQKLSSNNFRDSLNVWSAKDQQAPPTIVMEMTGQEEKHPPTNETSTGIDHQSVL